MDAIKELTDAEREEAKVLLQRGRFQILQAHKFYGFCLMRLKLVEDLRCPTLYTDAEKIGYNPRYVLETQDAQFPNYSYAVSEVFHELLHAVMGHCKDWKAKGFEPDLVNMAQDYAVNLILKDAGKPLHRDWLCDEKYRGLHWMEIYEVLKKDPKNQKKAQCVVMVQVIPKGEADGEGEQKDAPSVPGQGPAGGGGPSSAKGAKFNDWNKIVVEAAKFAQAHGDCPAWASDLVKDITEPVVDWRSVIARFAQKPHKGDYSYARPNKRYMAFNIVMPSLYSRTADLILGVDTSGSTWAFLNKFWGEVFGVIRAAKVPTDLVEIDSAITNVTRLKKPEDILRLKKTGGGGTDFRPFFDWIDGRKVEKAAGVKDNTNRRPGAVIFFTDGYGTYPTKRPPYPVLFVIPNAENLPKEYRPPFGQVLNLPWTQQ